MKKKLKDMTMADLTKAIWVHTGKEQWLTRKDAFRICKEKEITVGPYILDLPEWKYFAMRREAANWANPSIFKIPAPTYEEAILRCYLMNLIFPDIDKMVDVGMKRLIEFEVEF